LGSLRTSKLVKKNKQLILIVDDDRHLRTILERYLTIEGYDVQQADSGEAMRTSIRKMKPDLVILDLGLPDTSGFDLAQELRVDPTIGIIILTGSDEKVDKIVGLEIGADDYVEKPFDERELLARIRSVMRRRKATPAVRIDPKPAVMAVGNWRLNLRARSLHDRNGDAMPLTHREYQLFTLLAKNVDTVMSRDQISEMVSSRDWLPTDRSIDVLVSKLRKKIETDPGYPTLIKTIRGSGYVLTAPVEYLPD
jgi:two-component system, OmpR family, response regulator